MNGFLIISPGKYCFHFRKYLLPRPPPHTCLRVRSQHVHDAVVRIQNTKFQDDERLLEDVNPPEAGNSLIPDTAQHLLDLGVSNEGLLFTFDCQLESLQGLVVPGGPDRLLVVEVQHHLQLVGAAGVVQQGGGEALDLLPQHGVLFTELGLHLGEISHLGGELEGGEDGIFTGESDQ